MAFKDLSEEVHSTVLLCLQGWEAAGIAAVGHFFGSRLLHDECLWHRFVRQEFQTTSSAADAATAIDEYRVLRSREQCRTVSWRRVPCQHALGRREGSPGLFCYGGHIFAFGGWGHGPENDLHAGPIAVPLVLSRVRIENSSAMPELYEMKVTPLVDDIEGPSVGGHVRVVVTGGYLHGGYHTESGHFGVLEVFMEASEAPSAKWIKTGRMTPRSNHSATFVPPRLAGAQFPDGYLLVFGGNTNGRCDDSLAILDLQSFEWTEVFAEGERPGPRNSHTATLVEGVHRNPSVKQRPGILILGGGNGDSTNGGPPRGGEDFSTAYWLHGLENASGLRFTEASAGANGRGHTACLMAGTGTVLAFGGGRPPTRDMAAYLEGKPQPLENRATAGNTPSARAFGGGCGLPDGTVLVYGGWHPRGGTFGDFWAAHAGAAQTKFFAQLPEPEVEEGRGNADESGEVDPRLNFFIDRLVQGGHRGIRAMQLQRVLAERSAGFAQHSSGSDDEEAHTDEVDSDSEDSEGDGGSSEVHGLAEGSEGFVAELEADLDEDEEGEEEEEGEPMES